MTDPILVTGVVTTSATSVENTEGTHSTNADLLAAGAAVAQDAADGVASTQEDPQAPTLTAALREGLQAEDAQAALSRPDVEALVDRFSTEVARHPSDLAEEAQDTTSKAGRDMADINRVLRFMTGKSEVKPPHYPQETDPALDGLQTEEAKKLKSDLTALTHTADAKTTGAQSAAAMYVAAAVQTASAHFSSTEAKAFVANTLFADTLTFLSADNGADAASAAQKMSADLDHLEASLGSQATQAEKEIISVMRETLTSVADAKTQASELLSQAVFMPDGSVSIGNGNFGYEENPIDHSVQSDAVAKLTRFGGVMTPQRDVLVSALQEVDGGIANTLTAVQEGRLEDACLAQASLRTQNVQAADVVLHQVTQLGESEAKTAVHALFDLPGDVDDSLSLSESAAAMQSEINWADYDLDHPENFLRLYSGVNEIQDAIRTPTGEIDPAKESRLRPKTAPQEELLTDILTHAPWTTPATAAAVDRELASAAHGTDAEKAAALDRALTLLKADMAEYLTKFDQLDSIAAHELSKFAIDEQNPLGGMRGGLAAFAADCRFERFSPHTGSDGQLKAGDFPKTILARMSETVASGLDASNPAASAKVRSLTADFMNPALSEDAQRAAFDGLMNLLAGVGLSGSDFAQNAALFVPQPSAEALAAAQGDVALAQAQSFVEILSDPSGVRFAEAADGVLRSHPGDTETLSSLQALTNSLLAITESEAGKAHLTAVVLASETFGALSYNDFYTGLIEPPAQTPTDPHLRLADIQAPQGTPLHGLISAGQALGSGADSEKVLEFIGQLSQTDGDAVKAALTQRRTEIIQASGLTGQPLADLEARLQSEEALLLSQFDVLKKCTPTLLYGAHALYAAESGMKDAYLMRSDASENAAFMAAMKQHLPEAALQRCSALMRDGIRGEGKLLATGAALASLKATAAHLGRSEIYEAFGATTDVNMIRALRYFETAAHPEAGYNMQTDLSALIKAFKADTEGLAAMQLLGKALDGSVQAAQAFQRAQLAERVESLGITDAALKRIRHGIDITTDGKPPKPVSDMEGQTAGMALMAFNYATLNQLDDFDSETLSQLVGHYVEVKDGHYTLTDEELRTALLSSAARPMYDRERAVLLHELMLRETEAGRPADIQSILSQLEPTKPTLEALAAMTDKERDAALAQYEFQKGRFHSLAGAITSSYVNNAVVSNPKEKPNGPSLLTLDPKAAAQFLKDIKSKLTSGTLMQSAAPEGLSKDALKADQARVAAYQAEASERVDTLVTKLETDPHEAAAARRSLCAALTLGRFERGRYVLMSKVHAEDLPQAAQELNDGWDKIMKKPLFQLHHISSKETRGQIHQLMSRGVTPELGAFTRTNQSAQGITAERALTQYITDIQDPKTALALKTAAHCAIELTAESLGTSADKLLVGDSAWEGSVAVGDITVRPDQKALARLIEGKPTDASIPIKDVIEANLEEFLPANAAHAYVAALTANQGKLAKDVSVSLLLRNQILRKTKFFTGLVDDIRKAQTTAASFSDVRDSRSILFHERQRGLYSACLDAMTPGSSVAIDKSGHFEVLGTSLKVSKESTAEGASGSNVMQATLDAGITLDLSDGVVFTKNLDGTISVAVSKSVAAGAHAEASAKAGVSFEGEVGSMKTEVGMDVGASAKAGVSASYTLTVEQTLDVKDCALFMDRLVSGQTSAADLNRATVAHSVGVAAEVETSISAGAALGFSFEASEEAAPTTLTTNADGSTVETSSVVDEDGNTTLTQTLTELSGRSQTLERVTDKDGNVSSESHTVKEADGRTQTLKTEQGTVTPFSEGVRDFNELLGASASVSVGLSGGATATRTVRQTPTSRETEYHYSGQLTLTASASVSQEALEIAADLAKEELNLEVKESATFGVDNTYTRVDTSEGDKTTAAAKRTVCTFPEGGTPEAKAAQLQRLLTAQHLAPDAATSITTLALLSDLDPKSVSFESTFTNQALLDAGPLTHRDLCAAENYRADTVTLSFERQTNTTSLMTRVLNHAGNALNGAFEFSSTATRGQEISIELSALGRITPEAIKAALNEERTVGSLTP